MRKLTNLIKLGIYAAKCVFRDEGNVMSVINKLIKITKTRDNEKKDSKKNNTFWDASPFKYAHQNHKLLKNFVKIT